jgi:hypothetical protein
MDCSGLSQPIPPLLYLNDHPPLFCTSNALLFVFQPRFWYSLSDIQDFSLADYCLILVLNKQFYRAYKHFIMRITIAIFLENVAITVKSLRLTIFGE